jgi:hypothetical protein
MSMDENELYRIRIGFFEHWEADLHEKKTERVQ